MNKFLFFCVYNYSNSFGGQERYIESLFHALCKRLFWCEFSGSPDRLTVLNCRENKFVPTYGIEILNGNRALYLRGWRNANAVIRLYVQHSHVQDSQGSRLKKWVRKLLLRLLLRRMDIVIRVCDNALPDHYARGKIHTVYNGVFLPDLHAGTVTSRPFTLLMVGAVNENKNQRLALQLLAEDPDLHLLIVGDGPERQALELWARIHAVDSRVRWTGFVDDPSSFYLQADALLMLSSFEAFPYAVLEAMAHALPVVATRVGGVPEAITHEKDGLLLPRRDLDSLRAAVRRLQESPQWRAQLGQQARKTVGERFTVEKMTDNLLALIEVAANKKGLIP